MTVYTPNDTFTAAEVLDLTDLVKGGSTGDANTPLKALADRTQFVRNRVMRYEDIVVCNNDYTFDITTDLRKLILFSISDNKTFQLPLSSTLPTGTVITVTALITGIKALTVHGYGTVEPIIDGQVESNIMYLHDGESLSLVANSGEWLIVNSNGNFKNAGMEVYSRNILRNSIAMKGQLVNRADMPRLWAFAQTVGVIADATWLSTINYQGNFSSGNGTSTFRLPDERGMFARALDLGRGIDISGIGSNAGRYEPDGVLIHDHVMHGKGAIGGGSVSGFLGRLFGGRYAGGGGDNFGNTNGDPDTTLRTGDTGGSENIVKNIAKYSLILY